MNLIKLGDGLSYRGLNVGAQDAHMSGLLPRGGCSDIGAALMSESLASSSVSELLSGVGPTSEG